MRVSIVDYGNGNFGSLIAALRRFDITPVIWRERKDIHDTDLVILPGVGALREVTASLHAKEIYPHLEMLRQQKTPFLGICLGMQLFFNQGDEGGHGLGWLSGSIPTIKAPVLPHIGWNTVAITKPHALWEGIENHSSFYFVHSFRINPRNSDPVLGETEYFETFPSIIAKPPLYGMQFHPELSGQNGHRILKNFLERIVAGGNLAGN